MKGKHAVGHLKKERGCSLSRHCANNSKDCVSKPTGSGGPNSGSKYSITYVVMHMLRSLHIRILKKRHKLLQSE